MGHNRPEQVALTPGSNRVVRARRATSCKPMNKRPTGESMGMDNPTLGSKAVPALLRGKTAPGSGDQQRPRILPPFYFSKLMTSKL